MNNQVEFKTINNLISDVVGFRIPRGKGQIKRAFERLDQEGKLIDNKIRDNAIVAILEYLVSKEDILLARQKK